MQNEISLGDVAALEVHPGVVHESSHPVERSAIHKDVLVSLCPNGCAPHVLEARVDDVDEHGALAGLAPNRILSGPVGDETAIEREVVIGEPGKPHGFSRSASVEDDSLEEQRRAQIDGHKIEPSDPRGDVLGVRHLWDSSDAKLKRGERDVKGRHWDKEVLGELPIEEEFETPGSSVAASEGGIDGGVGPKGAHSALDESERRVDRKEKK